MITKGENVITADIGKPALEQTTVHQPEIRNSVGKIFPFQGRSVLPEASRNGALQNLHSSDFR
jgi:hypothetical protein